MVDSSFEVTLLMKKSYLFTIIKKQISRHNLSDQYKMAFNKMLLMLNVLIVNGLYIPSNSRQLQKNIFEISSK